MNSALGLLETKGLIPAIAGADAMVKAATVEIISVEKIGSAYVTVMIQGDVAAVKAAVDSGVEAAVRYGEVIGTNVIPRPHGEVARAFELGETEA